MEPDGWGSSVAIGCRLGLGLQVPQPSARHRIPGHGPSVFQANVVFPDHSRSLACRPRCPSFAMWSGFPDLGLLRGLPHPGNSATTACPPTAPGWRIGEEATPARPGSHVHILAGRRGGPPPAIGKPSPKGRARLSPWPPPLLIVQASRSRQDPGKPARRALLAGPYPPGLSRVPRLRGFHRWFLHSYTFPSRLAGPGPSGNTRPSRRCQGCSRPPLCLQDQAALSFTVCCDRPEVGSYPHPAS